MIQYSRLNRNIYIVLWRYTSTTSVTVSVTGVDMIYLGDIMSEIIVSDKRENGYLNAFEVKIELVCDSPFCEFIINSTTLSCDCDDMGAEIDWNRIGQMMHEVNDCREQLYEIIRLMKGHKFQVAITEDIEIFCTGELGEDCIDLGRIAECYGFCDGCSKYCYSFKNPSPWKDKCDCPFYYDCQHQYGDMYDDDGEEIFDSLWDFRCHCTKINGRQKVINALWG